MYRAVHAPGPIISCTLPNLQVRCDARRAHQILCVDPSVVGVMCSWSGCALVLCMIACHPAERSRSVSALGVFARSGTRGMRMASVAWHAESARMPHAGLHGIVALTYRRTRHDGEAHDVHLPSGPEALMARVGAGRLMMLC